MAVPLLTHIINIEERRLEKQGAESNAAYLREVGCSESLRGS